MVQANIVTLLGKAEKKLVKQLAPAISEEANCLWFFVDYAKDEVAVGEWFDVLLQGSEKALVPTITKITLKRVFDQFGNALKQIPKAFQTICCFQFNEVPKEIKTLPVISDWDYTAKSVSLARHEAIQLSASDFILTTMYRVWVAEIKNSSEVGKSTFTRPELVQLMQRRYKVRNLAEITKVLNHWKMLGLVEEKPNNKMELISTT